MVLKSLLLEKIHLLILYLINKVSSTLLVQFPVIILTFFINELFIKNISVLGGKLKETALHIAARVKDGEKCALMLLKSGAGPNLATHDGQTPVHVAAKYGNLETLLLLLEDGGDPQYKNKVTSL